MANSLAALRADLAREMGLLVTGRVTAGTINTVADINGLYEYDEAGALRKTLLYIRWDAGGASALPEGESRMVTAYSAASKIMTVAVPFSAAPAGAPATPLTSDIYEVYRAFLNIEAWNQAVNLAIRDAWPQVYAREIYDVAATGIDSYALPATADELLAVMVQQAGARIGWPGYLVPPSAYQVTGTPGTDLYCRFLNSPGIAMRSIRFIYKARYPELATNAATTDLEREYILAAAKANMYQQLQGLAGGQTDVSRYIQLMAHWQGIAANRKAELAAGLGEQAGGGKAK